MLPSSKTWSTPFSAKLHCSRAEPPPTGPTGSPSRRNGPHKQESIRDELPGAPPSSRTLRQGGDFHRAFGLLFVLLLPSRFSATAARIRSFKAASSILSPSWMSIARRTFPSRLELNRPFGSFSAAPFANVIFTTSLYVSPVHTMPPCE